MQIKLPFSKNEELNSELEIDADGNLAYVHPTQSFGLPGQPLVSLVKDEICAYIDQDFLHPELDKLVPYFWLITSQFSTNISALTEQFVRGRHVVISEDPELHLVWLDNRIFLKPIPAFLLSHAFWEMLLDNSSTPSHQPPVAAILGFMRSYTCLIQHESDFRIAVERRLLPEKITDYYVFTRFIRNFSHDRILDDDVSRRYHYGQLRLSRLNLWAKFALRRWSFRWVYWQYDSYFASFYGPMLFIFAILSLALSASQVGLAGGLQYREDFNLYSSGLVWLTLASISLCAGSLLVILFVMILRELIYAIRTKV